MSVNGIPIPYGIAMRPHDLTNNQDILIDFNAELDQIRHVAGALNTLGQNPNIVLGLREIILLRADHIITILDNLTNLYTRIRSILRPPIVHIQGGRKRRTTKRRRL